MRSEISPANQILEVVTSVPDCRIEQAASFLPALTSAQLLGEVTRLSQTGHVPVVLDRRGIVRIRCVDERVRHWGTKKKEETPNGTGTTRLSAADVR